MDHEVQEFNETINMEHVADSAFETIQTGKIIEGEIVTIDSEFAYVNVGTKSDGRIPIEEFDEEPIVGQNVNVMLQNKRLIDGMYQFSKKYADIERKWVTFTEWCNDGNNVIHGKFTSP